MLKKLKDTVFGAGILKDYEVGDQVASGGLNYLWKIHDAKRKSDKQETTLFIFEKSSLPSNKAEAEKVLVALRHDAHQIIKLRHPNILQVHSALDETKSHLVLETEPISSTLGNLLSNHTNLPKPPIWLATERPDVLEMKLGLLQIAAGLRFLHRQAKVVHLNVAPSSILLTKAGQWKLAGFAFAASEATWQQDSGRWKAAGTDLEKGDRLHIAPDLDYVAPEFVYLGTVEARCDAFSLGLVLHEIHAEPLIRAGWSVEAYKAALQSLHPLRALALPGNLVDPLTSLLALDPKDRLEAADFLTSEYCSDPVVRAVEKLGALVGLEASAKIAFLKSLFPLLPSFPARSIRVLVLAPLLDQLKLAVSSHDVALIPFLLPNILTIVKSHITTTKEFEASPLELSHPQSTVLPAFTRLLASQRSPPIDLLLLRNLDTLHSLSSEGAVASTWVPFLLACFQTSSGAVIEELLVQLPALTPNIPYQVPLLPRLSPQEFVRLFSGKAAEEGVTASDGFALRGSVGCLTSSVLLPTAVLNLLSGPFLFMSRERPDWQVLKADVLPRLELICAKTSLEGVKARTLQTLAQMLPALDRPLVVTGLLPILESAVQGTQSSDVVASLLKLYVMISNQYSDIAASHILPKLLPLAQTDLARDQFVTLMTVVHQLIDIFEKSRLAEYDRRPSPAALGLAPAPALAAPAPAVPPKPSVPLASNPGLVHELRPNLLHNLTSVDEAKRAEFAALTHAKPPAASLTFDLPAKPLPSPTPAPAPAPSLSLASAAAPKAASPATKPQAAAPATKPSASFNFFDDAPPGPDFAVDWDSTALNPAAAPAPGAAPAAGFAVFPAPAPFAAFAPAPATPFAAFPASAGPATPFSAFSAFSAATPSPASAPGFALPTSASAFSSPASSPFPSPASSSSSFPAASTAAFPVSASASSASSFPAFPASSSSAASFPSFPASTSTPGSHPAFASSSSPASGSSFSSFASASSFYSASSSSSYPTFASSSFSSSGSSSFPAFPSSGVASYPAFASGSSFSTPSSASSSSSSSSFPAFPPLSSAPAPANPFASFAPAPAAAPATFAAFPAHSPATQAGSFDFGAFPASPAPSTQAAPSSFAFPAFPAAPAGSDFAFPTPPNAFAAFGPPPTNGNSKSGFADFSGTALLTDQAFPPTAALPIPSERRTRSNTSCYPSMPSEFNRYLGRVCLADIAAMGWSGVCKVKDEVSANL